MIRIIPTRQTNQIHLIKIKPKLDINLKQNLENVYFGQDKILRENMAGYNLGK